MKIAMHFPRGHLGVDAGEAPLITAVRLVAVAFGSEDSECEKYGCDYENDVFYMRVDCQGCAKAECDWCNGTRQAQFDPCRDNKATNYYDPPNFWYKPSDFRMIWYKYIGRDVGISGEPTEDMLDRIFATHPNGMTIDEALTQLRERTEATQRQWEWMFSEEGMEFGRLLMKYAKRLNPKTGEWEPAE